MNGTEVLVVLSTTMGGKALEFIRKNFRVLQEVSPRVLILEKTAQAMMLQSRTEVIAVIEGDIDQEILDTLDASETLFSQAWAMRMQKQPEERPGEGLPWDATDFEPPDPPADIDPEV